MLYCFEILILLCAITLRLHNFKNENRKATASSLFFVMEKNNVSARQHQILMMLEQN